MPHIIALGDRTRTPYKVRVDPLFAPILKRWTWRVQESKRMTTGKEYPGPFYVYRSTKIKIAKPKPRMATYSIYLHRFLMNLQRGDKLEVDHINGDPLDNSLSNLRVVSSQANKTICRMEAKNNGNTNAQ